MRLQSDPTIIYGITMGQGKLDRELTKADITTPTPYNTYTIDGLPPGPIANPGKAALEAVLNPPDTKFIFFVADGSGGHAFAETLDEHNTNVAAWRKINAAAPATAMEDQPETEIANANTLPDIDEPQAGVDTSGGTAPADAGNAITQNNCLTCLASLLPVAAASGQAAIETKPAGEPVAEVAPEEPATLIPRPRQKPAGLVTAEAEVAPADVAGDPKPGSVITVGKRLIPIPRNKPKT